MIGRLAQYPYRASQSYKDGHGGSLRTMRDMRVATERALRGTVGPLLEIGGPTAHGYIALDDLKLPHGIIISNIENRDGASVRADVRRLPFAERSLGGIVMQGLTRVPEEITQTPLMRGGLPIELEPHVSRDIENVFMLLLGEVMGDYSGWTDPEIMNYSLRLAMLKEARRTVEPNGVLIATMLSGGEIRAAEQLGFTMAASTVSKIDMRPEHHNSGEVLMTLSDMNTPAWKYVEQVPVPATLDTSGPQCQRHCPVTMPGRTN